MLPLPLDADQQSFKSCCGKVLCAGCIHAMAMEGIKKGKEWEKHLCAFCRTLRPNSDEETIERVDKRMKNGNTVAFYELACCYADGAYGLQQDRVKANELWLKAGELGYAEAYTRLGYSFSNGMGVEADKKKAKHYYEIAAMNGDVRARHNLGVLELMAGNHQRTY